MFEGTRGLCVMYHTPPDVAVQDGGNCEVS